MQAIWSYERRMPSRSQNAARGFQRGRSCLSARDKQTARYRHTQQHHFNAGAAHHEAPTGDTSLQEDDIAPATTETEEQHFQKEAELAPEEKTPADSVSEFSSTSSEPGDTPDAPVFLTDDEDSQPRQKRQHSPDEA